MTRRLTSTNRSNTQPVPNDSTTIQQQLTHSMECYYLISLLTSTSTDLVSKQRPPRNTARMTSKNDVSGVARMQIYT